MQEEAASFVLVVDNSVHWKLSVSDDTNEYVLACSYSYLISLATSQISNQPGHSSLPDPLDSPFLLSAGIH